VRARVRARVRACVRTETVRHFSNKQQNL